jgi:hypothetical protein
MRPLLLSHDARLPSAAAAAGGRGGRQAVEDEGLSPEGVSARAEARCHGAGFSRVSRAASSRAYLRKWARGSLLRRDTGGSALSIYRNR